MSAAPVIRLAKLSDLRAINDIYNHYVPLSTCTYQTEPTTLAERREWFESRGPQHPVTVAELDGQVAGWASLSRFRDRSAYDRTVENALYVHPAHHRRGIGSALLIDSIDRAKQAAHRAVIAVIDAEQLGSIELHRRAGFEEVGRLREVGYKFGRWLDVVYMQRVLR